MNAIPNHISSLAAEPATTERSSIPTASRLMGMIDRAIPDRIFTGDTEQLRQARSIVGFAIVLVLIAIGTGVYFYWALPLHVAIRVELFLAMSAAMTFFLPFVLRHARTTAPAANLVITAASVSILATIVAFGGIKAPVLHWCSLPPMLAVLMGTRRSAWVWAVLGMTSVVGFVVLDITGNGFANHVGLEHLQGSSLWIQRSVDALSWLVVLITTAFLFERHKDERTLQLAKKNAELRHEIDQRKRAEERTRYLAYYDELTTLPNRQLFKEHLAQAMESADRDKRLVGLLFLDLDGFKEVNDTYGHSSGDALLQQVSARLLNCIRGIDQVSRLSTNDSEFVSRLGGDEFTILLDGLNDFSEAAIVAHRVLEALAVPIEIDSHEIFITASIGIAVYPGCVATVDELLRNADLAMYHAKKEGRNNFQFFEESMNESVVERATLAHALRLAVEREQLELYYQPILSAQTSEIVGVECLTRWNDPKLGPIPPDRFIRVAEQSGLIVTLGDWVIREACTQFGRWKAAGIAPGRIGINVSGQQFRAQRLTCSVITAVEEAKIDPECVEIEITETAMMIDEAEASRCLNQLKRFGVSIALDDFGTGYSSLSYIRRFPVDALKIDRSFVEAMETNSEAYAIAIAILAMAQRLGLRVVAEGVETESQAELLRRESCDELQGFLYSRPLAAEQMTQLLRREAAKPGPGRSTGNVPLSRT